MFPITKLQVSNHLPSPVALHHLNNTTNNSNVSCRLPSHLCLPPNNKKKVFDFSSLSLESSPPSLLTSSVGSSASPLPQWNFTRRHILMLNAIACAVAVSASWLFFSAIPALLAFRRAAESLEKLMDVMREELPDTMAAVRLSGMEISDLTMELSDLGQEITKGVRSSTQAVRVAEDRLRQWTTVAPKAMLQEQPHPKTETVEPALAKTARGLREGIVNGRAFLQIFFSLTRFSKLAMGYFAVRGKKQ